MLDFKLYMCLSREVMACSGMKIYVEVWVKEEKLINDAVIREVFNSHKLLSWNESSTFLIINILVLFNPHNAVSSILT